MSLKHNASYKKLTYSCLNELIRCKKCSIYQELEGDGRDRFKSAIINIRVERFGGKN